MSFISIFLLNVIIEISLLLLSIMEYKIKIKCVIILVKFWD